MNVMIPKLGLTMESAELTSWLVADGDRVEADQPIAEITTDKIEFVIVAPGSGVIHDLAEAVPGKELPVTTVIARIESS